MPGSTKALSHSASTPQLSKVTNMISPTLSPRAFLQRKDSDLFNTIRDPRAPSPASEYSRNGSTDSGQHPDLSDEVANLSAKLVTAINHQTALDDNLQATQNELESARELIARLEFAAKEHEAAMQDVIKRSEYDRMETSLKKELAEEKKQRIIMEREKKRIEAELENLTSALFEEANAMVAAARKETEACERRNDQLKNQLNDSDILLASQQEQLQDLKAVVEKMSVERDESDRLTQNSTAPSTPGPSSATDKMSRLFEAANLSPYTGSPEDITPEQPLRFSHLISPVLRDDLASYKEFKDLLNAAKSSSSPPSRVGSGNYGNLNVLGFGGFRSASVSSNASAPTNGSSTSLPVTSATTGSSPHASPRMADLPPMKENPFYKRALAEDIEPTLRLDQAPGISWMARRQVINSMTTGSFSVEPHPPIKKFRGPVFACSMCGENRVGEMYNRRFRFRLSESEEAQRYPLCDYCLGRVRSTCDYISFIRMVREGHWRADTEDEVKSAWEESVKLRERMFWAKVGGGVIPAFISTLNSPTMPDGQRQSEESSTGSVVENVKKGEDPFRGGENQKRVSIGKTVLTPVDSAIGDENDKPRNDFLTVTIGEDVSPLTPVKSIESDVKTGGADSLQPPKVRTAVDVQEVSSEMTPVDQDQSKEKDANLVGLPGSFA